MISAEEISKNLPPPGKQQTAQSYCITARLPVEGCQDGNWLKCKAVSHNPGSINNVRVSIRHNYNQYPLNNNCAQPWLVAYSTPLLRTLIISREQHWTLSQLEFILPFTMLGQLQGAHLPGYPSISTTATPYSPVRR